MIRPLDLVVFFMYLAVMLVIGGLVFRRGQSPERFTVGSHKIPGWAISLSLFATFVSSISYLALPASAYQGSWNAFVFSLSIPVAAWMAVRYFIPLYRRVNSPSAYTYLERRFGPWARIYASSMYLLTQVTRVGTILFLMALVPNQMFGWNITIVIISVSIVMIIYSAMGGIQAVVWTDAVQAIILIGGAILCLVFLAFKMPGGFSGIISAGIEHHKFELGSMEMNPSESTVWVVLVYGLFINVQNFGVDQNYIQRYMTSGSLAGAKRSAFWGAMLYIPVSLVFVLIGTALYALYHSAAHSLPAGLDDPGHAERVFPYFIAHELPAGLTGLLLASIFASGMSTISTSYNSVATVILTDYFEKYTRLTERKKMLVLYLSTATIGLLGIVVGIAMIHSQGVLELWWKLASVLSGGVLGLFLLGAFSRITGRAVPMAAVLAGLIIIVFMTVSSLVPLPFWSQFHPYLTIVLGTTTIFVAGFLFGWLLNKRNELRRGTKSRD